MRRLKLSALIFSAVCSPLALSTGAFAQEEEPLPVPEQSPPDAPEEAPAEDRPYDAPLNDDPVDGSNDTWSTPPAPVETGPLVDDRYNTPGDADGGLIHDLWIGPTVQLGFPHPLTYGIDAVYAKVVSFGFSTGSYKVTQIDKAEIKIKSTDVHVRWHPAAGSFFLGAAYGNQDIKGKYEDDVDVMVSGFPLTFPARVDAHIKSSYFTPHIGWLAVYDSGFTLGFEIGAQIPLGPKTSVDATIIGATPVDEALVKETPDYKDLKKQADDAVKLLGKKTVPYVTLLKLGWLF